MYKFESVRVLTAVKPTIVRCSSYGQVDLCRTRRVEYRVVASTPSCMSRAYRRVRHGYHVEHDILSSAVPCRGRSRVERRIVSRLKSSAETRRERCLVECGVVSSEASCRARCCVEHGFTSNEGLSRESLERGVVSSAKSCRTRSCVESCVECGVVSSAKLCQESR